MQSMYEMKLSITFILNQLVYCDCCITIVFHTSGAPVCQSRIQDSKYVLPPDILCCCGSALSALLRDNFVFYARLCHVVMSDLRTKCKWPRDLHFVKLLIFLNSSVLFIIYSVQFICERCNCPCHSVCQPNKNQYGHPKPRNLFESNHTN